MTNFVIPQMIIGGDGTEVPTIQMFRRGFIINGNATPSWQDIILSGVNALTLVNAKADGLNYLKLFGGTELLPETYIDSVTAEGKCEQTGTPAPDNVCPITCNNGVIKYGANGESLINNTPDGQGTFVTPNTGTLTRVYKGFGQINGKYFIEISDGYEFIAQYKDAPIGSGSDDWGNIDSWTTSGTYTFDSASTGYYYGIAIRKPGNSNISPSTFDGTMSLRVVSIYTDGTTETITDNVGNVASCQNLLAVGDYKDTQEILSGAVTRNVGILVLDGTEDTTKLDNYSYGTNSYMIRGNPISGAVSTSAVLTFCTHFKSVSFDNRTTASGQICYIEAPTGTSATKSIILRNTEFTSLENFKTFLQEQYVNGTPFIIMYPLGTGTTTETVTGQTLNKTPLTYAGSVSGLTGTVVESSHTTPTPTQPLQINCNNGVVKVKHQSGLPVGYTRLSSINSTKGIGLNNKTTNNTEIEARFFRASNDAQYVYQSDTDSSGTSNTTAYIPASARGNWRFGNIYSSVTVDNFTYNQFFVTTQNKNGVWVEDTQVGTYTGVNPFTSTNNLIALGIQENASINIDYLIQRESGVVIGKYLACKRDSDNVCGLYDVIGDAFYTNNEATITGGEVVNDPIFVYTDGTTETVEIHGKNLWNPNTITWTNGALDATTGQPMTSTISHYSSAIPVKVGETYTFSLLDGVETGNTPQSYKRIIGYSTQDITDFVDQLILINLYGHEGEKGSGTFTVPSGVSYIRVSTGLTDSEYQLELGSTATTYEAYYSGGSATAQPLYAVGDYKDVQSVLDGGVTRNVGVKVLDGSEDWQKSIAGYFYTPGATSAWNTFSECDHFCTHFVAVKSSSSFIVGKSYFGSAFNLYPSNIPTVNDFKQWLSDQYNAGNPVIVIYPKQTATTETVTAQTLTTQEGTNIVEITQASMDNLPLEVSYKAGVTVTIEEVENAQLDNSVEVTING